MCYFVLIATVPNNEPHVLGVRRKLARWGRSADERLVSPIARAWGGRWASGDLRLISATPGSCACGGYTGPDESPERVAALRLEEESRLREKHRKLGWSFAKSERALEGWRAAQERHSARRKYGFSYTDLVSDAAAAAGEIGVLVIWCSVGESGKLRRGPDLRIADLGDEQACSAVFEIDELRRVIA